MALTERERPSPAGGPELPYTVEDFDGFYKREYAAVNGLAYVLTGGWEVAEELAQDAFVAAHRHWDKVSQYDEPGAFVRRVLVNAAVSHRRRAAAEAKALVRLVAGQRQDAGPLDADAVAFWRLVRALPRRQAQATALFYMEDRSVAEIAEVLGCAEATVKVHLHRARAALARRLGVPGGDHDDAT